MRLFFAIQLPDDLRRKAAALAAEIRKGCPDLPTRWVSPENLHLTAAFVGNIDESRLPALESVATRALTGKSPFTASLEGLGVFPSLGRPRVLWIGLFKGRDEFTGISKILAAEISSAGLPVDLKEPKAHVTLARFKILRGIQKFSKWPPHLKGYLDRPDPELGQWEADSIKLMASALGPDGPAYSVLRVFPLRSVS